MSAQKKQNIYDGPEYVYYTLTASTLAGMTSRCFTHPLDTLKAKLQVESSKFQITQIAKRKMLQKITIDTFANEGIKGFFRGVGISVLGTGPAFALFMTSYEYSKKNFEKYDTLRNNEFLLYMSAGFSAEFISCLLWLPIDVIKERLQVQSNLKLYEYKNSIDAIKQISKAEGILGLYKGYGATLASFGPYSALYFMFYEKFKKAVCIDPKQPSFLESLTLAGLAGSIASTLTNPLDVSKVRIQVQRAQKSFQISSGHSYSNVSKEGYFGYKNLVHGLYLLLKHEGIGSMFKGLSARLLMNTPQAAISMSLTETFRTFLIQMSSGFKH
ncbi:hypothetical protein ABPG74_013740 [Tetrahymena malaccensis]